MFSVVYFTLDESREIAYFPETQRFFIINGETKAFIADIQELPREELLEKHRLSEEEYDNYLRNMSNPPEPDSPKAREGLLKPFTTQRTLPRLVIHVSNDCNLRCVYCYANGGNYQTSRDLMDRETLDRTLKVFYERYDTIEAIQFFGGEPLMNVPLLEYACEEISKINEGREHKTTLGIVINGTLINDRFCDLVNRYHIAVTVSYDGVPEVNDRLRVYPDGSGTSDIIVRKIGMLKEKTGQPVAVEATYTRFHEEAGVSVMGLFDYLNGLFPGVSIQIAAASGNQDCAFIPDEENVFPAAVAEVAERIINNNGEMVPCHLAAKYEFTGSAKKNQKLNPIFCAAGLNTLAVTTKGDIYPCFMLADVEEVRMGNVFDRNVFGNSFISSQKYLFDHCFKADHEECRDCFAKETCTPCLGLMYLSEGKLFHPSRRQCEEYRRSKEAGIKGLALIQEAKKKRGK